MGYLQNYTRLYLPSSDGATGYVHRKMPLVHRWLETQNINEALREKEPSSGIIKDWNRYLWITAQEPTLNFSERAIAFLSLRCYVSWYLAVRLTQKIQRRHEQLQLDEIISVLLEDGGEPLFLTIIQDHFYYQNRDQEITSYNLKFIPLAWDILKRWQPLEGNLNLRHWIEKCATSQNISKKIGIDRRTTWFILCQTSLRRIKKIFVECERIYIFSFRYVYLASFAQKRANKSSPYPPPSIEELQQIILFLKQQNISCQYNPEELKEYLIDLANRLRIGKIDLYQIEEEFSQEESPDELSLPNDILDLIHEVIEEKFPIILWRGISQIMAEHIADLRKRHRTYANYFDQCCYLRYCQGLSGKVIAEQLGFGSQSKVSRITQIEQQINKIELYCVRQILEKVLSLSLFEEGIDSKNLITIKEAIQETIQEILAQRTFIQAKREVNNSNLSFTSEFSEAVRVYFHRKMGMIE